MNIDQEMKLHTLEELAQLEERIDLVKIQIDFGNGWDGSKEMTSKEYAEFLENKAREFKNTVLEPLFQIMARGYTEVARSEPDKVIVPPKVHYFSTCGQCGCSNTRPCYTASSGCYTC